MKEQRKVISWINAHKKALIIAGVSIGTLIAIVLGLKNREAIVKMWSSIRELVEKPAEKALNAPIAKKVVKAAPVVTPIPTADQVFNEAAPIAGKVAEEIGRQGYANPFEVSRHIRTLPLGQHASPEKVEAALKLDIILQDGQTLVDAYMKGVTAA